VARGDDVLAFVEVKTSERDTLGPPELRVNREKQRKLAEAALEYISGLDTIPENLRFDVIGILWRKDKEPEITHIESAFVIEEDY
jgi:putative endonuclease